MADETMFDKIVEFGMGMTMARQIPQMMDMAMYSQSPNNTPPEIKTDVANVYIANNGQQAGPFSESEVKQLIANSVLTPNTMVWMPNMPQWAIASQVPTINKLFLLSTMRMPAQSSNTPVPTPNHPQGSPIRDEVIAAVSQLGYGNANARKLVDEVLSMNPGISSSEAVKEVLKRL